MTNRLFLSSFAYRYAIGNKSFVPPAPMTAEGFVKQAAALGFKRVLLCENLGYAQLNHAQLLALKQTAIEHGVELDVGFREMGQLDRHIEIAKILGSHTLRVVISNGGELLPDNPQQLFDDTLDALLHIRPALKQNQLVLGIENNFDLPIEMLVELARRADDPCIGLIMDTTNCLGILKDPYEALREMAPYVQSIHLKDYIVRKVEAGYRVEGVGIGEGWLNVRKFLSYALALCPNADIAMEYSIRRSAQATVEQAIEDEARMNADNARKFFSLCDEMNQ